MVSYIEPVFVVITKVCDSGIIYRIFCIDTGLISRHTGQNAHPDGKMSFQTRAADTGQSGAKKRPRGTAAGAGCVLMPEDYNNFTSRSAIEL